MKQVWHCLCIGKNKLSLLYKLTNSTVLPGKSDDLVQCVGLLFQFVAGEHLCRLVKRLLGLTKSPAKTPLSLR